MKKLYYTLLICLLACSTKAQFITATLTVTNVPSNGNTLQENSDTRTWTSGSVSSPATQIAIAANPILCASNLFNQTAQYQFQGTTPSWDGGTNLTYSGPAPLAFTFTAGWCKVTYVTNANTPIMSVMVNSNTGDYSMSFASPNTQTIMASGIVGGINSAATNQFKTNAYALLLYVPYNGTFFGTVTNGIIVNATAISGTVVNLTNGSWLNGTLVNGFNTGNPFKSPGGGSGSEQFGDSASASVSYALAMGALSSASGTHSTAVGHQCVVTGIGDTGLGDSAGASGLGSTAIGSGSTVSADGATALGYNANAGTLNSTALGSTANSTFTNSTAVGYGSTTTANHQLMLGTSSETTVTPGTLQLQNGVSNFVTVTTGTSVFNGILTIPAIANSSLANSNNADVSISTNSYVQLSGPTGSFYIAGIAGGVDGRIVQFENSTGQTMVIGNQSGVESTAANRILTGTGADRQFSNNPGVITLRYDGSVSRWKITGTN